MCRPAPSSRVHSGATQKKCAYLDKYWYICTRASPVSNKPLEKSYRNIQISVRAAANRADSYRVWVTASQTVFSTTQYYFCISHSYYHRNTGIKDNSSDINTDVYGSDRPFPPCLWGQDCFKNKWRWTGELRFFLDKITITFTFINRFQWFVIYMEFKITLSPVI